MIFVTGGTGLVGTHLLHDLAKAGKQVRALKRPESNLSLVKKIFDIYSPGENLFDRIEWCDGDILDIHSIIDAMDGITDVYHCAAVVSFERKDANLLTRANIEGTVNVMNAALDKNIRKLCHVSSTAAIGGQFGNGNTLDEKTRWKDGKRVSNYAYSKYFAELEAWRAAEEGLNVVIVNPSLVLGPGEWGKSSTNVFLTAWKGLRYYTDGGNAYVDARDVSKAMIMLMESDISHERFLVVSENKAFREFFSIAATCLGKPVPSVKVNPLLASLAWRLEGIRSAFTRDIPRITRETSHAAQRTCYYSNRKIRNAIGMEFIPVEQSIRDTCKILREHLTPPLS